MNNGQQLQTQTDYLPVDVKVMTYNLPNGDEIKLNFAIVKKYLVTGNSDYVTDQELVFFMQTCKALKLNPFLRECYLIKYSKTENAQIITSIQHIRDLAITHALCQGWRKGLILWDPEKREERRTRGIVYPGYNVIGAWLESKPKGWEFPFELEINLDGYIRTTSDGQITKFWKKENQPTMIMKVVESQGLRTLYGEKTKNLYIREELPEPDQTEGDLNKGPVIDVSNLADDANDTYAATRETPADRSTAPRKPEEVSIAEKEKLTGFTKKPDTTKDTDDDLVDLIEKEAELVVQSKRLALETWHPDNWRNMRAGDGVKTGFGGFVYANVETFHLLPVSLQMDIVAKWQKLYPRASFPVESVDTDNQQQEEKQQEEKPPEQKQQGNQSGAPELSVELLKAKHLTDFEKADLCITSIKGRDTLNGLSSWNEVFGNVAYAELSESVFAEVKRVYSEQLRKIKDGSPKRTYIEVCPAGNGKIHVSFCELECLDRKGCKEWKEQDADKE